MATLGELLNELEIEIDDNKNEEEEEKFEFDEKTKPHVDKILEEKSAIENKLAESQLVIQTLKESIAAQKKEEPKKEEKKDELGLEENDPYAGIFGKLFEEIKTIKSSTEVDHEAEFKNNLAAFAKDHKDIAKYAQDMDAILVNHPTLASDIPTLYELGKKAVERRDSLKKTKRTETGGTSTGKVIDIQESKSIAEAFSLAQKQVRR